MSAIIGPLVAELSPADRALLNDLSDKLDAVGVGLVAVGKPLAGGALDLVVGDDYSAASGRSIRFQLVGGPSLTDGTVSLILDSTFDSSSLEVQGQVLTADAIQFEVGSSDTSSLYGGMGAYNYRIVGQLAGGETVTLAVGAVNVFA
jgi:hypothetical protein